MTSSVIVRPAEPQDCRDILRLIVELAVFEKAPDEVEITEDDLRRDAFGDNPIIEMIVAEDRPEVPTDDSPSPPSRIIGTAIFYEKYSTWKGRGLHLEDLVVDTEHRRRGVGSLLFREVMRVAAQRNYARMDWQVLDWNRSAIDFYEKYGAEITREWLSGRFDRQALKNAFDHG